MGDFGFRWDVPAGRFRWPSRCPYPDCGTELTEVPERSVLGWCDDCERPYEVEKVAVEGGGSTAVQHRPDTAYCVRTGRRLIRLSVLDWCEAGGEPGRSNSLEDVRGEVFGSPGLHRSLELKPGWTSPLGKGAQLEQEDLVSSVSVIRGHVVAVTRRGTVGVLDATTGESRLTDLLEWPGGTTNPADPMRMVRFPPAFRGTRGVIVAGHEAQFVDLQNYLFRGRGVGSQWRAVRPDDGKQFLGPPLGADAERGLFCLLEGAPSHETQRFEGAALRFFGATGEEEGRQEVPDIVLPPVVDRATGRVVWLDHRGGVHWFGPPGSGLAAGVSFPRIPLSLSPTHLPLFLAAADGSDRTELWLASKTAREEVIVHRALMDDVEAGLETPWEWGSLEVGRLGELNGFAVGIGSRHARNAASRLMALSTDQGVQSMDRTVSERPYRNPVCAPQAIGATLGSHDPPIVTSAGVLSRIQGHLVLDTQGLGWGDDIHKAPVAGRYREPQGIAIFGRRIYVGRGLGVDSFSVIVDERSPR
jgi:hypothetical protein